MSKVLQFSLEKIEELRIFPDIIVSLEATFPFRPKGLLDMMILQLVRNGLDSIIAAKKENKALWAEKKGEVVQIEEGLTPRKFKKATFVELRGVGCITHPEFLRRGSLLGNKIGLYEINDPYSQLEVRDSIDFEIAEILLKYLDKSKFQ